MHKNITKFEKGYINMKKKATLALALAMLLSLSSCGSNTETAETTASETEVTAAADETANEAQADTETEETAEETTAETEAEAVVHADIEEASPCYYGGVMFKTAENEFYYYRFSDKKLFDLNEYEYFSEYTVNSHASGSIVVLADKIINVDTNEVLYDLSDGTASLCNAGVFDGRYYGETGALAIKVTPQGFDGGDPVIVALKNDGSVIGEAPGKDVVAAAAANDRYIQITDSNGYSSYLYDTTTNEKLSLNISLARFDYFPLETDNYIYYIDSDGNGARYDKNTAGSSVVLSANDYSYISSREINAISNYMDIFGFNNKTNKLSVIDTETDSVVDFDLSSFAAKCDNELYPRIACSNYTVVDCYKSNTHYIAMLDRDGNALFDPVKTNNNANLYYSENYFVCCDGENSFVVDTNTMTVTYPDEGLSFESFDTMGSDILVIKDSDRNYFLANAAAPNDLYSPFDDCVQ